MKYEKLNRIPAKRTIWPENTVVDFEAYETKSADAAFDELVKWYTDAKNLSEKLEKELSDTKEILAKTIQENSKAVSDATTEAVQNKAEADKLSWKNQELENQLNETKKTLNETNARLVATQTDFNAMVNRINNSTDQNNNLQAQIKDLLDENTKLKNDLVAQQNTNKSLDENYNKALNQLAEVEKTMGSITELISFYKEWKKNS